MRTTIIASVLTLLTVLSTQALAVQLEFGCPRGLQNREFLYAQKSFYNDKVRLQFVDTAGEPTCCPVHVLVLLQSGGQWLCYHVTDEFDGHWGRGFMDMNADAVRSDYSPQTGLTLVIPTSWYRDGINDFHGQVVLGVNFTRPDPTKVFVK
jgi:hypothetical protein